MIYDLYNYGHIVADTNKYGYLCIYTCETLCSRIATTLLLQRAQDWFTFCTLLLYSIYICYIMCGSTSLIPYLWLHRALGMWGWVYFGFTSQG